MTEGLIHDDAVGPVAGVDPDHGHRLQGEVDEIMATALGYKRSRVARQLVALPFNHAGCRPLNDGDRLIEHVAMAREASPRLELTVAATNSLCTKISVEEILKIRRGCQL